MYMKVNEAMWWYMNVYGGYGRIAANKTVYEIIW